MTTLLRIPRGSTTATLPAGAQLVRHGRVVTLRKSVRVMLARLGLWYRVVGLTGKRVGYARIYEQ